MDEERNRTNPVPLAEQTCFFTLVKSTARKY